MTSPDPPTPTPNTPGEASGAPRAHDDSRFASHARLVMGLTLGSRISGLAREAICGRLFGVSPIWSAWVTAFVVPNLFRRLFGEGAISAAFLPEYARLSRTDPQKAARLASLTVGGVTVAVGTIVLIAEIVLIALVRGRLSDASMPAHHTVLFLAVMLPYAPLICGAAILGGMLQAHGRFAQLAGGPILVNVAVTVIAWIAASKLNLSIELSVLLLSFGVLIGGVAQLAWSAWVLRRYVHWTRDVSDVWPIFRRMLVRMVPVVIGMATLQLGTALDALIAGMPVIAGSHPWFLGGAAYPLDEHAAAVLTFAQRLYQFPLGVFGIAIATVAFPALSRLVDRPGTFRDTVRQGCRLSAFIAIPASVGLVMVSRSLVGVVYEGGEFGPEAAARVAPVLASYAPAVVAYSLIHVMTRSFYAAGMTRVPMMAGVITVVLNAIGNIALIWPLQERGLAVSTSVTAFIQLAILMAMVSKRLPAFEGEQVFDAETWRSILASFLGTGGMVLAIIVAAWILPTKGTSWSGWALGLTRDVGVGAIAYLGVALALHRPEPRWLMQRKGPASGG